MWLLLAGMVAAPLRARPHQAPDDPATVPRTIFKMRLPKSVPASLHTLHDQSTVALSLDAPADGLAAALRRSYADQVVTIEQAGQAPQSPGALRAYLHIPDAIGEVRLVREKNTLSIVARTRDDLSSLKARLLQHYLPQINAAGSAAAQLHDAETLLLAGKVQAAAQSLSELLDNYPLQPWAALRLADIAVLQHGRQAGCDAYLHVYKQFETRAASMVAALHAAALGCADAPTNKRREWESLLLRGQADDPASRWLAQEAHWALEWTRDLALSAQAADYGARVLGQKTYDALAVKLLLLQEPYVKAAFAHSHADALVHHPDRIDLQLLEVQALCALDLGLQADTLAASYAKGSGPDRAWFAGAGACIDSLQAAAAPSGDDPQLQQRFDNFTSRMQAVTKASLTKNEEMSP